MKWKILKNKQNMAAYKRWKVFWEETEQQK